METKIKKYKKNKINQLLFFYLSKYGMIIKNGFLKENSFGAEGINISKIQSIEYTSKWGNPYGGEGINYCYQFTYSHRNRKKLMKHDYYISILSAESWKELLHDLLFINPNIIVSFQIDRFMKKEYIDSHQWKFNVQKNDEKQIEKRGLIEQEHTYLFISEVLFSCFFLFIFFILLIVVIY